MIDATCHVKSGEKGCSNKLYGSLFDTLTVCGERTWFCPFASSLSFSLRSQYFPEKQTVEKHVSNTFWVFEYVRSERFASRQYGSPLFNRAGCVRTD